MDNKKKTPILQKTSIIQFDFSWQATTETIINQLIPVIGGMIGVATGNMFWAICFLPIMFSIKISRDKK